MKKTFIYLLFSFIHSFTHSLTATAQSGIVATDGVYVPRMTTAQRTAIITPTNGQMIYNTDDNCFNVYQKGAWQKLCGFDVTLSDTWTQKANFGETARLGATGFSIGSKGYIGTGDDGTLKKDFWEYDPATNAWTQKANFGGTERFLAVGFSIGSKGYIGTGNDGFSFKYDFWEYDPATNAWSQKANFGGTSRLGAVGFSIGSKGYIGTGYGGGDKNDFWEYDPIGNLWTQKANFGGTARYHAVGFSIGSKGYIGTGLGGTRRNDFWEYDPASPVKITQQGNVFNGANQLVLLDVSGKIINEAYIAPTLLNGWVNYNVGFTTPGYYKDKENRVQLKGLIKNGATPNGTVLFNLPAAYRPTEIMIFVVVNGSSFGRVDVYPSGDVKIVSGNNSFLSLDGITFRAEQ